MFNDYETRFCKGRSCLYGGSDPLLELCQLDGLSTTPEGAKVYADGQYLGTTPVTYSDTKIVGSSTNIRIEKEGYKTVNAVLNRSEQADIGAIVGGLFVWIPFLWTMKYNAEHNYEMEPINGSAPVHHVADTAK